MLTMTKELTKADVVRALRTAIHLVGGSQARWAAQHQLSRAYVNDVLIGKRDPGPAVLDALGLEKIPPAPPKYRRKKEGESK